MIPEQPAGHDEASPQRIGSVDGLRATAFLLVFAFHSWEFAGHPYIPVLSAVIAENTRVDLFIVLAGFCLFLPFARSPERIAAFATVPYLRRRLRRIVLPYYAALGFAILLPYLLRLAYSAIGLEGNEHRWPAAADVLSHLTFTHLFFENYWDSINGSLWTMSLEVQLYVLFPLLLMGVGRFGWRALLAAALACLAYRLAVHLLVQDTSWPNAFLWTVTGLGRLIEFVAGMAAASLAVRWRRRLSAAVTATLGLGSVAAYVLGTSLSDPAGLPLRELLLGVCFATLVILAVTSRAVEAAFAARPLARLGFMAYSMFLVHQPIVYYASELARRGFGMEDGLLLLVLLWTFAFYAVLAVGYILHVLVERPCIRWSRTKRPIDATRTTSTDSERPARPSSPFVAVTIDSERIPDPADGKP